MKQDARQGHQRPRSVSDGHIARSLERPEVARLGPLLSLAGLAGEVTWASDDLTAEDPTTAATTWRRLERWYGEDS